MCLRLHCTQSKCWELGKRNLTLKLSPEYKGGENIRKEKNEAATAGEQIKTIFSQPCNFEATYLRNYGQKTFSLTQ